MTASDSTGGQETKDSGECAGQEHMDHFLSVAHGYY